MLDIDSGWRASFSVAWLIPLRSSVDCSSWRFVDVLWLFPFGIPLLSSMCAHASFYDLWQPNASGSLKLCQWGWMRCSIRFSKMADHTLPALVGWNWYALIAVDILRQSWPIVLRMSFSSLGCWSSRVAGVYHCNICFTISSLEIRNDDSDGWNRIKFRGSCAHKLRIYQRDLRLKSQLLKLKSIHIRGT